MDNYKDYLLYQLKDIGNKIFIKIIRTILVRFLLKNIDIKTKPVYNKQHF